VQINLARNNESDALVMADRLAAAGPGAMSFSDAADRAIYKRVAARWKAAESAGQTPDLADAGVLVRVGKRVIDQFQRSSDAMANAAVLALYANVAKAATLLATRPGAEDAAALTLAVELDTALLKAQPRSEEALRRLSANAERAGNRDLAMECWRVLFSAAAQGTPEWFEARYQSLRLLSEADGARARELLAQHRLLYADYGPAPWGPKLKELDDRLGGSAPPPGRSP
jgi:hypothetical protein